MDIAQISVNCFLTSVPFQLIYVVLPLLYMTFTMQTMFLPVYPNHRCNQRHCTITLDYIFQTEPYEEQIKKAAKLIREADYILVGRGAGISTAAGAQYGGDFVKRNFGEFIEK